MLRFGWFIIGVVFTCIALALSVYFYLKSGGVQMAVDSPEFPFETAFARMALHASYAGSLNLQSPVPLNSDSLTAGAQTFKTHCAGCHGVPGKPSGFAKAIFPHPPQLFEPGDMVTGDPDGKIYWIVTNGIRMTAMPEFKTELTDTERWQLVLMLKQADKLPPAALAALSVH